MRTGNGSRSASVSFFVEESWGQVKNHGDRFLNETMKWISLQKPVPMILIFRENRDNLAEKLYLCTQKACEAAHARPSMQASWLSLNRSFAP
jgi:hypothetical protein